MTYRRDLAALLGDDHGLDDDQVTELLAIANDLDVRYPKPDDAHLRTAALTAARRFLVEPAEVVIADLRAQREQARQTEVAALAALRQGALQVVPPDTDRGARGVRTRAGYARAAGLHLSNVRRWFDA